MAFNYDPNLDPEREQERNQLAGASQVTSGGTVATGGGVAPPGQPARSGSFANLNKYLDANTGSQFGEKFAGKIQGDVAAAGQAQQEAATSFQQASDAGTVRKDEGAINAALTNPTAPTSAQDFERFYAANYQGPTAYADHPSSYQKASGATQKASDVARAGTTEGGRFALLGNYFGKPDYSRGQKSLDNLLSQGDTKFQEGLQQARENAAQARTSFQGQGKELSDYAAKNAGETQAAREYARTRGGEVLGAEKKAAGAASDKAKADYDAFLKDVAAVNSGNYGPLSKYGVNAVGSDNAADDWGLNEVGSDTGYWGANLSPYIDQGNLPNASNVLTPEQQKKLNALESMMHGTPTAFTPGEAYKPGGFKASEANQAIANKQQEYRARSNALLERRNAAVSAAKQRLADISKHQADPELNPAFQQTVRDLRAEEDAIYAELNALRSGYGLGAVEGQWIPPV